MTSYPVPLSRPGQPAEYLNEVRRALLNCASAWEQVMLLQWELDFWASVRAAGHTDPVRIDAVEATLNSTLDAARLLLRVEIDDTQLPEARL